VQEDTSPRSVVQNIGDGVKVVQEIPEDEGAGIVRNVGNCLLVDMKSHP
jgi:hypothetical protein